MEISLLNQINLTTDKECSQISILGITVIIKRKSSQHLEMKLSSLTIFINILVSTVPLFLFSFGYNKSMSWVDAVEKNMENLEYYR